MTDLRHQVAAALADRYRLERELGQGGMATVYLAHDLRHERKVAIKVLRPELAAVIGAERFLREIKTIATLQHPHILGLIDSGEVGGTAYFVMPFVEGESLRDRLTREKQLPISDAVRIATETASALDYAHRHGVIHRDIKPENILLHDGQVLVADFGIALAVTQAGGTRMTETGMSLGTPHYMSPEQAMGEREITARSDVYALGCVTYEMLLGEPPFTGPTAQAIVAKVMTEEPRRLTLHRRTIPLHVEAAVLTALAKLPADRFGSAAEFARALTDPSTTFAGSSFSQRDSSRPRLNGRVLVGVGSLALGSAAVGWLAHPNPAPTPIPVARFTIPVDSGSVVDGQPRISPDGSTIAYVTRAAGVGTTQLSVRRLDELTARRLDAAEGGDAFVFSPDGRSIAIRRGGALEVVRLDGGGATPITPIVGEMAAPIGIAWGPGGSLYYSMWPQGVIYHVSVDGGTPERLTEVTPGIRLYPMQAVAGGRGLVVQVDSLGVENVLWAVFDLERRRLGKLYRGASPRYVEPGYIVFADVSGRILAQPFDLRRLEPTGQPRQVADLVGISPESGLPLFDISATGTLVALPGRDGGRALGLFDRSGNGKEVAARPQIWAPRFSPDGRRLAYGASASLGAGQDVWIRDLTTGTTQRLTSDAADNNDPQWSPDGRFIAYSSSRDSSLKDLFIQPSDGSAGTRPLLRRAGSQWTSDWSAGGLIVFTDVSDAGGYAIWMAPNSGGKPTEWLSSQFVQRGARLSPDGRWAAYTSNETGQAEVYLQTIPVLGAKVLVSVGGGRHPVWRGDGRELYYWAGDQLMAAALSWTRGPTVVSRTPLFTAPYVDGPQANYDAQRDGRRFVVLVGQETGGMFQVTLNLLGNLEAGR